MGMSVEIADYLAVGLDDLDHVFGVYDTFHPCRSARHYAPSVELVRVKEVSD